MRRRRKMVPRIAALTRKSRPGKEEADILQSRSKTGTKARGMRASRSVTKVFNFPSSEGSTRRAIIILQTGGNVPDPNFNLQNQFFFVVYR